MNSNCQKVVPSQQTLNPWQKVGLELVSLFRGRDVVLAIDLTESVGLNDEGRLRLRQIIEDSLQKGDSVYVVPFAATVNPLTPDVNSISVETVIPFWGKKEDIERILQKVPFESNSTVRQTDIQLAESFIYPELAKVNQCRLSEKIPIKAQSVIWLTDAPLLTEPGITSKVWIETPASSPFRDENSLASRERKSWLETLPLQKRSQNIENYQLSVVDLPATVQEFCTPAPGGKETCLVTPYLIEQLWLSASIFMITVSLIIFGSFRGIKYLNNLKQAWQLRVTFEDNREEQTRFLRHQQSIAIGDEIECPGTEVRGYLKRQGDRLYLESISQDLPIYYQGREITNCEQVNGNFIRINCPHRTHDFEIVIQVIRK